MCIVPVTLGAFRYQDRVGKGGEEVVLLIRLEPNTLGRLLARERVASTAGRGQFGKAETACHISRAVLSPGLAWLGSLCSCRWVFCAFA